MLIFLIIAAIFVIILIASLLKLFRKNIELRSRFVWLTILLVVGIPLGYLLTFVINIRSGGFINIQVNENPPQAMFKSIIADPIPKDVINLEGTSIYWQGYTAYFRFKATDKFISQLLEKHKEFPCDSVDIKSYLDKKDNMKGHLNFWAVDTVKTPKCYKSMENYKNKATHSGGDVILLDKDNNIVYFSGWGC